VVLKDEPDDVPRAGEALCELDELDEPERLPLLCPKQPVAASAAMEVSTIRHERRIAAGPPLGRCD
jgi:hypothetical protein